MYLLYALFANIAITLLVACYYHRDQLQWLPSEDIDGDTRNTLLGMMVVFHDRPCSYARHLMRHVHNYFTFFFCLCLLELAVGIIGFMVHGR